MRQSARISGGSQRLGTVLLAVLLATAGGAGVGSTMAAHQGDRVPFDTSEWKTNFKKHSVPLNEIMSGGPRKDGIPAIDRPRFQTVAEGGKWLKPNEPVVAFEAGGEARAYPIQILIWHEIVNDTAGGTPVSITFCPLCNTAIAFDRRLEGKVLDFGTTGMLRYSDLVMYDRQTESFWQQVTGEAIVGDLTGKRLNFLPSPMVSWEAFERAHPGGKVLSRDTGYVRSYGQNPYVGYDDIRSSPFLYRGPKDGRLPAMERVVAVSIGAEDVAYPFSVLAKARVIADVVGGKPIVIFFRPGTASPLDSSAISAGRDIGAAAVYNPVVDGRRLNFRLAGDQIIDAETQSVWNILGRATAGPLRGKALTPIVHGNHFWFVWAVFKPRTRAYKG